MQINNIYILKIVEPNNRILWFKFSSLTDMINHLNNKYGLNKDLTGFNQPIRGRDS